MLELPACELQARINEELQENPALEEGREQVNDTEYQDTEIVDDEYQNPQQNDDFIFSLYSNGRLKQPMKFEIKDIKIIRILDTVGALLYVIYGILIHSWANIFLNTILILIQIYRLIELKIDKRIQISAKIKKLI